MATVTQEYAVSSNLTVTALNGGIASSATLVAGWTSGTIDNTSDKHLDKLVSAKFTLESAGLSAGEIRVYAYAMLDDSTWPDIFSSGTEGTEGTATVLDTEQMSGLVLLWGTTTDTGASEAHNMPPMSLRSAFGYMPAKCAIFVTQSSGAALETSGNQVTVKGAYEAVA